MLVALLMLEGAAMREPFGNLVEPVTLHHHRCCKSGPNICILHPRVQPITCVMHKSSSDYQHGTSLNQTLRCTYSKLGSGYHPTSTDAHCPGVSSYTLQIQSTQTPKLCLSHSLVQNRQQFTLRL